MDMVSKIVPELTNTEKIQALKDAEDHCLSLGLTTVSDAGLSRETIELIDSMQQSDALKIKVYAMVSVSKENLDYYLKKGIIEKDRFKRQVI